MATEWNIKSRAHVCAVCGEHLQDKDAVASALKEVKDGYERFDAHAKCWKNAAATRDWKPFSVWEGIYTAPPPPDAKKEPVARETADELLRHLCELEDPAMKNVVYVLAVMLERGKTLVERDAKLQEDGTILRVYENRKTGESFVILDPRIRLENIGEVQQQVVALLSGTETLAEVSAREQSATGPGEAASAPSLDELKEQYAAYVQTYAPLNEMMELKRIHTAKVLENAQTICTAEGFDAQTSFLANAAALLHDTGRYEQLKRYNTFRDSDSVDHAQFSHDIVVEKGWLDALPRDRRDAILFAIRVHNKRDIEGEGEEPPSSPRMIAAKVVRDADKLDIFRVLEDQLANHDWRNDARAFWNLPAEAEPSKEVLSAIREKRPVDYQFIKSIPDFVLIQAGWMISGLYFASTRRLCAERGHLEFRRKFLKTLTDDPSVDEICDMAKEALCQE